MADASSDTVDAAHLTELLRAAGMVHDDQVTGIVVERSRQTLISTIRYLRVDLGPRLSPLRLFLKTRRPDSTVAIQESREADFYSLVAPLSLAGLLPRCFDSVNGGAAGWHILLEDLTEPYEVVSEWPIPPTLEQCERIVGAHAHFHAAWWDDPRLGRDIGVFSDENGGFERTMADLSRHFTAFVDQLGDRLPAERRRIVERLLASAPRLYGERYRPHRRLTIIHGDAHVWNALFPKDPKSADVRLIDWDGWRIDAATDDLAYMIALHWYPDRRRRFERRCLESYHATLLASGVRGYDFDALWLDYRLSALWQVLTPIWQAAVKVGPFIWFPHFERIMAAVADLDCLEFLD